MLAVGAFAVLILQSGTSPIPPVSGGSRLIALSLAMPGVGAGPLWLSLNASPDEICQWGQAVCSGGVDATRVTLGALATGSGVPAWPAVQVLFLLETTPYDGVADTQGIWSGACGYTSFVARAYPLCDESNGVPYFVANAANISQSIQQAHPSTQFTFGLVDFGATEDHYDDNNGIHHVWESGSTSTWPMNTTGWDPAPYSEYHVDVGGFVGANQFPDAVESTFVRNVLQDKPYLPGSNLTDNFLHSSSITALYGALYGAGVNWSDSTHHVIVVIGSTAPRAPSYTQNYCVSDTWWNWVDNANMGGRPTVWPPPTCVSNDTNVTSPSCEPAYQFNATFASPACVGWVSPTAADPTDSIAELAAKAPSCASSLGGNCTIDTIDLFDTSTDPQSIGWYSPAMDYNTTEGGIHNGSTAGSWWAVEDAQHVIRAGCELANATGGTWDGPVISSCGPNRAGTLLYVPHGPVALPTTSNPTLGVALENLGVGDPPDGLVARGGQGPLFTFVPYGGFRVDTRAGMTATCTSAHLPSGECQGGPTIVQKGSTTVLEWNWSQDTNVNDLYSGDRWTAEFYLVGQGPPFDTATPIDACFTAACDASESSSTSGLESEASFVAAVPTIGPGSVERESLPLVEVTVLAPYGQTSTTTPPSPPPAGGVPPPVPAPSAPPVPSPVGGVVISPVGIAAFSSLSAVAGVLGAAFAHVTLQRRAIRMRVPVGVARRGAGSRFDDAQEDPRLGRFG